MADGYALALQKGLNDALEALPSLAGKVFAEAPQNAVLPYVRIGAIEPRPMRSSAGRGAILTFSIEAHSRPTNQGRVEATRLAETIVAALDENEAAVPLADHELVSLSWLTTTVAPDADAQDFTAIAAFEAVIDG